MDSGISALSESLPDVQRRYVDVGGRAVHYRVTGEGPAVVMLHDSPRSSRLHLDTIRRLSRRFRVFALDTPGYGNSQPLDIASPTIGDFAAALGATLGALGLGEAPLYATHTSAKIALEYAAITGHDSDGHPASGHASHMPNHVILDGLSIPVGPPDPAYIDAYMRPFVVEPTGGYLAAEWTRMRDMLRWFPWFDQRPETRMPIAMPTDAWIEDYVKDFLSAGPAYSSAYRAAMLYDPMPALRAVTCPVLVAAKSDDVLYASLDRVPAAENPALRVERLSADGEEGLNWLENAFAAATVGPVAITRQPDHGARYVDLPHGSMRVHRMGPAASTPLLILSAPTTLHALRWQAAFPERATLVPELPGFGESDPLPSPGLDAAADALAAMLDALDCGSVDILATGFATPIGATLAARHPGKVSHVILDGCFRVPDGVAPGFAERLCPTFAFDAAGGHLHRYWHMLRDAEASWPWHSKTARARRSLPPILEAGPLHDALVGILKQPEQYGDIARAASLSADADRYPVFAQPALLLHKADDPAYLGTTEAAARLPLASVTERPIDIDAAADAIRAFLTHAATPANEVAL
ncbi:MAG TPA: alpha/beta fold hydrolase [Sphingobium sp.]|uniref:alpha/beta fold hydrolase n=1 Tax=Sphingobium sp. TaxID=1912891 RepID=UPI002ED61518